MVHFAPNLTPSALTDLFESGRQLRHVALPLTLAVHSYDFELLTKAVAKGLPQRRRRCIVQVADIRGIVAGTDDILRQRLPMATAVATWSAVGASAHCLHGRDECQSCLFDVTLMRARPVRSIAIAPDGRPDYAVVFYCVIGRF